MSASQIYLLHPPEQLLSGIHAWLGQSAKRLETDPKWNGIAIHPFEYRAGNNFGAAGMAQLVRSAPGPVVVLDVVSDEARSSLQRILLPQTIVLPRNVKSASDLLGALVDAQGLHENGEAWLPRKLVLAVMIIDTLTKANIWSDQNHIGPSDVSYCQGIGCGSEAAAKEVAKLLHQVGLLARQTVGGGSQYALNVARVQEISEVTSRAYFQSDTANSALMDDRQVFNVRLLLDRGVIFDGVPSLPQSRVRGVSSTPCQIEPSKPCPDSSS